MEARRRGRGERHHRRTCRGVHEHNLLRLLVALGMDEDAALLETTAGVVLERLAKGLSLKSTQYKFLRDESRRAAAACRAFLVFLSLLNKNSSIHTSSISNTEEEEVGGGTGVPGSLLERRKKDAAAAGGALREERMAVLLVRVVEGGVGDRSTERKPLMGWSKSGERHPVFFAA